MKKQLSQNKNAIVHRIIRAQKKARGECYECDKPAAKNRSKCFNCLRKAAESRRNWRRNEKYKNEQALLAIKNR